MRDIQKHIQELREKINAHNYKYYVLDQPEISDKEFDDLMKHLQELESLHPELISPDSPTQRVGGKSSSTFAPHPHNVPMLSLENVYSENEFLEWLERLKKNLPNDADIELAAEPKMDGVSLAIVYEDGLLKSAATRGDGEVGEDVTENVKTIRSIPLRFFSPRHTPPKRFECRGEIYILKKDFEELNQRLLKSGEKTFANPRNAAAGSLRQKDPRITARRSLRFAAHSMGEVSDDVQVKTHSEFIETCRNFRIPTLPGYPKKGGERAVIDFYNDIASQRSALPFEIDGIVVKVNDLDQHKIVGQTAKNPRWAAAFKFMAYQVESKILAVEFSVGRTGIVTPVAKVQPVACGGVTISSISLHNFDEIERLGVNIHDQVLIERAGDVIPKIIRLMHSAKDGKKIQPPAHCPSCGGTVLREKETEVAYRCINPSCPAQLERGLLYFAGRDGMNIEGLGEAIVQELIRKSLVKDFADLYMLTKQDLLQCKLFAEKKAENLLKQIADSKSKSLSKLLAALGIRHAGEKVSRVLAEQFGSLEQLMKASMDDLLRIPELGPIIAESVTQFFSQKKTLELIRKLKNAGVNFTEPKRKEGQALLAEKIFVFTGELESYSRSEAEELVRNLGGIPSSSVSKKTSYVVCGKDPGSKLKKAQKLGVAVLNEEEFKQLIEVRVRH